MAASTLRFAIIVGLVVAGIVVIDQAFPALSSGGDGGTTVPITGGNPTVSQSPSPSPTGTTGTEPAPSPTVVGIKIGVFNGLTGVTGLAAETMQTLIDDYGYVKAQDPADAPTQYPVTTIYYRGRENRIEAEYLANDFFVPLGVEPDIAKLDPNVADIDSSVQLAIFLGNDYAAAQA